MVRTSELRSGRQMLSSLRSNGSGSHGVRREPASPSRSSWPNCFDRFDAEPPAEVTRGEHRGSPLIQSAPFGSVNLGSNPRRPIYYECPMFNVQCRMTFVVDLSLMEPGDLPWYVGRREPFCFGDGRRGPAHLASREGDRAGPGAIDRPRATRYPSRSYRRKPRLPSE